MYAGDSFHNLSGAGQAGLLVLSAFLALVAVTCVLAPLRTATSPLWRMAAALVVFYGFLWLSPQIYYVYYRMIFDDLPWQMVVGPPPDPALIIALLLFQAPATLAAPAQGALGWLLLALGPLAVWGRRKNIDYDDS